MTPERAFHSRGFNPKMNLWVHDWHAMGTIFMEAHIIHEGRIITGMRGLTMMDMASHFNMHWKLVERPPDAATANDVITLLDETFSKYQQPKMGVVISNSVWYSSFELLADEDTAPRGKALKDMEIDFGPMSWDDKKKISDWVTAKGIRCEFNADDI